VYFVYFLCPGGYRALWVDVFRLPGGDAAGFFFCIAGGAEGSITCGGVGVSMTGGAEGDFFVAGSSLSGVLLPGDSLSASITLDFIHAQRIFMPVSKCPL
jgi:hypothetical protein